MKFLLDTNVVSELRRPTQADQRVVAWFRAVDPWVTCISAASLAELEQGAEQARRKGQAHAPLLRRWIDEIVLPAFEGRILPIDATIALRYGRLHLADPIAFADVLIAATAQVHALTVVTRNIRDFALLDTAFINPWAA